MTTLRVLIADDHAIVRTGLKQILRDLPQRVIVDEAANGAEALKLVRDKSFDVMLLDIQLGDRSGLDVLKHVKAEKPSLPVLILSMYSEDQYGIQGLKAGAAGYLTKETAPELLVAAITRALAGGRYISPPLAEKLAEKFGINPASGAPHEALTNREMEVLQLIAGGRTLTEMAEHLSVSKKTISTHRDRLLKKMNMRTNAELVRYAVQHGLVT